MGITKKKLSQNQTTLPTEIPQKYLRKISQDICACEYCGNEDFGQKEEFVEYLERIKLPKKYYDVVSENFRCPSCNEHISLWDSVITLTEDEKDFEQMKKNFEKKLEPELYDFYNFLVEFPYLGCLHHIGRKILNELEERLPLSKIIENQIWYRTRKVESDEIFTTKDMKAPPSDKVTKAGRFNHCGKSFYYLSEKPQTSCKELKVENNHFLFWLQEVHINKIDKILDLTIEDKNLYEVLGTVIPGLYYVGKISKRANTDEPLISEYLVPRFISDAARKIGYNGIIFTSSCEYPERNLVLFNPNDKNIELLKEPGLMEFKKN